VFPISRFDFLIWIFERGLELNSNLQAWTGYETPILMLRNSLLVLNSLLALPAFRAAAQSKPDAVGAASSQAPAIPARITQAIDETQFVRLRWQRPPPRSPGIDQGVVGDATPMKRMMLVLQRKPRTASRLSKFMDEQLSKDSPNFHNWLTPEQFGKQFGPADADIQDSNRLASTPGISANQGGSRTHSHRISRERGAGPQCVPHEIHQFNVNGESRQANLSEIRKSPQP